MPPAPGIGLGPHYITAAQALGNGTVIEASQVEGGNLYKSIFSQSSKPLSQPKDLIVASLKSDFEHLKHDAEAALDRKFEYIVMSNPEKIDLDVLFALRDGAHAAGLSCDVPIIGAYPFRWANAVHQAYEFHTCHGRGQSNDCDLEDDFVVIVLSYEPGYLDLALVDTSPLSSTIRYRQAFPQLGETSAPNARSIEGPAAVKRKLEMLVASEMSAEVLPYDHKNWKPSLPSLGAVVLSGDASRFGFKALRSIVGGFFDDPIRFKGLKGEWLRDQINPNYAVAFGAARRAKEMVDAPHLYRINNGDAHEVYEARQDL